MIETNTAANPAVKPDANPVANPAAKPDAIPYANPAETPSLPVAEVETADALAGLIEPESRARRWTFAALAVAISLGFLYACFCYWVPANGGVDQNGYLSGGRKLAETGTMKFAPVDLATGQFDPHQYVGGMWVGADYNKPTERFYPKYPIGLPLIVAICLKIGGPEWGPWLTFTVNPIAMAGAVLATFFLLRTFCGSYLAVLGQLIFATSPVIMLLAIDANSHATATFCVTVGMVALIAWWRRGSLWMALIGGLLLGYAGTIRYSEATLCLVIAAVVLIRLGKFWKAPRRDWLGGVLATVGWLIPMGGLIAYNLASLGSFTGYDPTNESKPGSAFTFEHFQDNWETLLRHLTTNGLFFTFPIAIIGLAWMFAWRRRVALVMSVWILPCMACYTFYYWAPDGTNIGYLRFFTTIIPPLTLCGVWVIGYCTRLVLANSHSWMTRLAALSVAPLVAIFSTAVALQGSCRELENQQFSRLVLKTNADQIMAMAPAGSVILGGDNALLNYLQFMREYVLFEQNTYREHVNRERLENWKKQFDSGDPQVIDPGRVNALYDRLKGFDQNALDKQQRETVLASIAAGKQVFALESPTERRRDRTPKQQLDVIRKLTAKPAGTDQKLYADVVQRWRLNVIAAGAQLGKEDRDNRRQPRIAKSIIKPIAFETPWLLYKVSKQELPISPERQAALDYEAEQKANAEQADAQRAEAKKARLAADKKLRVEENQVRLVEQKRREEEQKAMTAELRRLAVAQSDLQTKLTTATAQLDQTLAAKAAAEKQLAELNAQQHVTADAIKQAAAEQGKTQQSLAALKSEQDRLSGSIADAKGQLASFQQKIESAKSELRSLETPATQPTTQPASE